VGSSLVLKRRDLAIIFGRVFFLTKIFGCVYCCQSFISRVNARRPVKGELVRLMGIVKTVLKPPHLKQLSYRFSFKAHTRL
jgi:hypothetical protein